MAIGGEPVVHELDFAFLAAHGPAEFTVERRGTIRRVLVPCSESRGPGIVLRPSPIRRCRNHCLFCFVDQLPRGLRRSLYVKDDDIRHSFLHGNFVTLTDLTDDELNRIARMHLSPLYISVHATEPSVRNKLLGRPGASPILPILSALASRGIEFHTQIVLCPGWNDGVVLDRTIGELLDLPQGLLSIGVVPVGLTRFSRSGLAAVTPDIARRVCAQVNAWGDHRRSAGCRRTVYAADEFFIKAGIPIPPAEYYEGYPQAENGIGLVRLMCEEWEAVWKRAIRKGRRGRRRFLVVTSLSAATAVLRHICCEVAEAGVVDSIEVLAVENRFFGPSVTVAGLLTAGDVVAAVRKRHLTKEHVIVVPSVMFNTRGYTLDGWSAARMERVIGFPVRVVESASEFVSLVLGSRCTGEEE